MKKDIERFFRRAPPEYLKGLLSPINGPSFETRKKQLMIAKSLSDNPYYRLFRLTPPDEISEILRPALKAAWEDVNSIRKRAKALREKNSPSDPEPGNEAQELSRGP